MDSIITRISPVASKVGTSPEVTITGNHFTDGGAPKLFVDDVEMTIASATDTTIVFSIPKSMPFGTFNLVVLNGSEQP